jgi:peptide/nickel transport system permease protein
VTLLLSVPTLAIAYLLALAIGLASALRPYGLADRILAALSFLFYSVPLQWAALMLVLWGAAAGLPIQGLGERGLADLARHLFLPVAALASGSIALLSRYLRSALLHALAQEYVVAARARGLSQAGVVLRHALPNAALTLVALIGLTLPALVSGAVIVERIFGLPGMGKLTIEAVLGRDVPVLMGAVTVAGVVTMLGTLLSDLLYAAADPRISVAGARE